MKNRVYQRNRLGIFLFLLTALFPRILCAEGLPAKKSNEEERPIQVLAKDNGVVVLFENNKQIAAIYPSLFTEGWKYFGFEGAGKYPQTQWEASLPDGGKVSIKSSFQVLKTGIHVRYSMTPHQPVTVINVRATVDCTYADWQGGPFRLGKSAGPIPQDKGDNLVIAQSDDNSFSIGPSPVYQGLTLKFLDQDLQTTLLDGRKWGSSLSVIFTHHETASSAWEWPKGMEKNFDFILSFNHPTVQVYNQEPRRPFAFRDENVSFVNPQAGVTLFGTLALPKGPGPFPVVEVISGAGPHKRDGYFGNGYFLVLTDDLTRRGVAVLRYDKRGTGETSGNYETSTSQDFADDAACGVEYLKGRKDIDPHKIGLIGHSEGGVIAPMVAAHSKDVAFIVLMAGTGVRGDQIMLRQREHMDEIADMEPQKLKIRRKIIREILEEAVRSKDDAQFKSKVREVVQQEAAPLAKDDPKGVTSEQEFWEGYVNSTLLTPWAKFFLLYDPKTSLRLVSCPVLALAGDKDWHVPPDDNLPAIESALKEGKNQDYTLKLLPNINHGFQTFGAYMESADPLQSIAPEVLTTIGNWIGKHTK